MLQIKEYDFSNIDDDLENEIKKIDDRIKSDLKKISRMNILSEFFTDLNKVADISSDFSFIKASINEIEKLKDIDNLSIKISNLRPFNSKLNLLAPYLKKKRQNKNCTLNNILEFIFGYHLEERTQMLKEVLRTTGHQNCIYCLAQYTTSYGVNNKKIYVKGNLDHIHPKSLNALVSLSINNLVPVCAHCNQRKSAATTKNFSFNPFDKIENEATPTFNFKNVLEIKNGNVDLKGLNGLEIENINPTLESRLELTSLYKEYKIPIWNLLERYKKFNSLSYQQLIEDFITDNNIPSTKKDISDNLEYFISETPYTDENIQNIPLHKFKSDFYKELEEYKKEGKIKFT